LDREADVVALPEDDLLAGERRVQLRELLQADGGGLEEVRNVGALAAQPRELSEVAFLDDRHGRHLPMGRRQVLGDEPPHSPQRDTSFLSSGSAPSRRR
jgi:hypothetical protein